MAIVCWLIAMGSHQLRMSKTARERDPNLRIVSHAYVLAAVRQVSNGGINGSGMSQSQAPDSKSIQSGRVIDQNPPALSRLRSPEGKLVQDATIIDRKQRKDVGGLASWMGRRIRMGPICAPKHA